MDAQSDTEHRRVRQVLQRSHYRRVCDGSLARQTLPPKKIRADTDIRAPTIIRIKLKDIMSNINLRSITNGFQDVRLGSLASWSRADEFSPHDPGGPFVVTQEGYDPDDATLTPDEFILRRSGEWLSLSFFFQMPENGPTRVRFPDRGGSHAGHERSAAKVQIIRPGGKEKAAPGPAEVDDMAAALQKGEGGATGAVS